MANLRAALAWLASATRRLPDRAAFAGAIGRSGCCGGHLAEGGTWLERAL